MAVSPASAGSTGQFPFTAAEMSGMGIDAFTAEVGGKEEMQLGFDGDGSSKDTLQSGVQLPWTFSLADLTADLTNLEGDLSRSLCSMRALCSLCSAISSLSFSLSLGLSALSLTVPLWISALYSGLLLARFCSLSM